MVDDMNTTSHWIFPSSNPNTWHASARNARFEMTDPSVVESGGKTIEVAVMTKEHGLRQLEEEEIDAIVAEIEAEKDAAEATNNAKKKDSAVEGSSSGGVTTNQSERKPSNLSRRDGNQRPSKMDFEVPPTEHVPRELKESAMKWKRPYWLDAPIHELNLDQRVNELSVEGSASNLASSAKFVRDIDLNSPQKLLPRMEADDFTFKNAGTMNFHRLNR
ncbi:unnamed protein product [Camellia sinensis]